MRLLAAIVLGYSALVMPWASPIGGDSHVATEQSVVLGQVRPQLRDPDLVRVVYRPSLPTTTMQAKTMTMSVLTRRILPKPVAHKPAPKPAPAPAPKPTPPPPPPTSGWSPNHYPYGWCTWGAAHLAHDNVDGLGNAYQWIGGARARGLPTGSVPRVGATVVFQPGVQGSNPALGHVAHVVAVGSNGTFEAEGMATPVWGQYSYLWYHTGWGVSFIY